MTFQSTLPHGERPVLLTRTLLCNDFNPRSRMGSDMTCRLTARARPRFQSTLPHGERLASKSSAPQIQQFQSTLPHGERP